MQSGHTRLSLGQVAHLALLELTPIRLDQQIVLCVLLDQCHSLGHPRANSVIKALTQIHTIAHGVRMGIIQIRLD